VSPGSCILAPRAAGTARRMRFRQSGHMTDPEIRAFVDEFLREWEREDVAALVARYADDCEVVSPIFHTLRGRDQLEASFRDLFRAFSDAASRTRASSSSRLPEAGS
jgi:ketosteroid isomerase-like protein